MDKDRVAIVDGPDKPALQQSLVNELDVHFHLDGDAVAAQIVRMDELSDGFTFGLRGRVTSRQWKDRLFEALYSVEGRSGWLRLTP